MASLPDSMTEAEYPVFRLVNMAFLATVGGSAVNGVAAIHSEIIKEDIFQVSPQLLVFHCRLSCPAAAIRNRTIVELVGKAQNVALTAPPSALDRTL